MNEQGRKIVKRPILISIMCVLFFVVYAISLLLPMLVAMSRSMSQSVIIWAAPYSFIGTILFIIALIGYWKMKRWGVLLYTITFIAATIINLCAGVTKVCLEVSYMSGCNILPYMFIPLIPMVIGVVYWKKME